MADGNFIPGILSTLFEVWLRATVVIVLALIASLALRGRSATLRRRLWVVAIAALFLLPIVSISLPTVQIAVLPGTSREAPIPRPAIDRPTMVTWPASRSGAPPILTRVPSRKAPPNRTSVEPRQEDAGVPFGSLVILLLYGAGLCVAVVRLVRARSGARKLLRGASSPARAWQVPGDLVVRENDSILLPVTVGSFRPVIIVPTAGRGWPEDWRRAAIAHEAAHVRSRDPLIQLLTEICVALYWFHPLVHIAVHQFRAERELAADDAVVKTGFEGPEYAAMLFELACLPETLSSRGVLVPLLTPAGLKARVTGILDTARVRSTSQLASMAMTVAAFALLVPLAVAMPIARSNDYTPTLGAGTVVGRVVDSLTLEPVAGAEVGFRFYRWPPITVRVVSDENGQFHYPWDETLPDDFGIYTREGNRAARAAVQNVPFGTKLPLTMQMGRAPTLSGTVRDRQGVPVPGATVSIWRDEHFSFGPGEGANVTSDAEGRWRMPGILYGVYRLMVTAPWGVKNTELVRVESADLDAIALTVAREWPVTGRFTDENGNRLSNLRFQTGSQQTFVFGFPVSTEPSTTPERYLDWDQTADDGTFRLLFTGLPVQVAGELPDGSVYFGSFRHLRANPAKAGANTGILPPTSADAPVVVAALSRSVPLSGTVRRPDGEPVKDAMVVGAGGYPWNEVALSDAQGHFQLKHVPPIPITLVAVEQGTPPAFFDARGEAEVNLVAAMSARPVEIVMQPWPNGRVGKTQ